MSQDARSNESGERCAVDFFPFEDLPDHVHVMILSFLNIKHRVQLERANKKWQANAKIAHKEIKALSITFNEKPPRETYL